MILSRRVALGGTQLDSLDTSIVIRSFDPGTPKEALSAVDRMGGAGQRVTMRHWQVLEATLVFAIDVNKRNITERRRVFDLAKKWAMAGGWLTFNGMSGKRMYVDKATVPASGDLRVLDEEYTIVFQAYNVPFWQDDTATTVTAASISTGSMTLQVPGEIETQIDATLKNISGGQIAAITIAIDGHQLVFTAMTLANGATLVISHGTDGILRATVGGATVYGKLTGSDDLVSGTGTKTITITCAGALEATVSCYGRYL